MINDTPLLYNQSYRSLEKEVLNLSYDILFDDSQLSVYSTHIADIIISACIDIEAIVKQLCISSSKHKSNHCFNDDCIKQIDMAKECTILIMPCQIKASMSDMLGFILT